MELKSLNEFIKQFSNSLPPVFQDFKSEFEDQFRIGISYALQKLDLVSRQEFDIQAELLMKLEAKITEIEQKIYLLENPTKNNP